MDIQFNLRDRVALIAGPFTQVIQNLMMGLTQMGVDVAIVGKEAGGASKFCQNILDQREINEKNGRAIAVPADLNDVKQMKDAVGQVAQTFGSLDIFIDAHLLNTPAPVSLAGEEIDLDPILQNSLKTPLRLTQTIVPFLKGRKRGRILYLLNGSALKASAEDLYITAARSGLIQFAKGLAMQTADLHMTVNVLALGLTEEYLLGHFAGSASIKEALEKIKVHDSTARICEPDRVTHSVLYLISQFGIGVSGQVISL